jgi:hypothetical protein
VTAKWTKRNWQSYLTKFLKGSPHGKGNICNSRLPSRPTYMMGFYLLPASTHRRMDQYRSRFFWGRAGGDFKYHMVKWEDACRPKEFIGLGIVNTQIFNECLMTKWISKMYKQKDMVWVRLLAAKYMREGDFFKSKHTQCSQFWKSLHKIKHLFKWGAVHKVSNGKITKFWHDLWLTPTPLRVGVPELFEI